MKALPRAEDGVAFEDGVLTLTDGRETACRGGARAGRRALLHIQGTPACWRPAPRR
jgi:hypothetical protein